MTESTYSDLLQCNFQSIRVIAEGELAIDLPDLNCTDMSGAIIFAKSIMPDVHRIATYGDGIRDTEYRLSPTMGWYSVRHPHDR